MTILLSLYYYYTKKRGGHASPVSLNYEVQDKKNPLPILVSRGFFILDIYSYKL